MSEVSHYKPVPDTLYNLNLSVGWSVLDPICCGYNILFDKFQISKKGVIHLGGHLGQELPRYAALGFRNIVLVEPLFDEFDILRKRVTEYNERLAELTTFLGDISRRRAHAVRCAISDVSGDVKFYKTNVTSLSSISQPDTCEFIDQSKIDYSETIVPCKTLDELVCELPFDWTNKDFNYLRMNIQGSELKALKGGSSVLSSMEVIDLETNIKPRYANVPHENEFDEYLGKIGFSPVIKYSVGSTIGNIIYLRSDLVKRG